MHGQPGNCGCKARCATEGTVAVVWSQGKVKSNAGGEWFAPGKSKGGAAKGQRERQASTTSAGVDGPCSGA
jgi:hypothetical protein